MTLQPAVRVLLTVIAAGVAAAAATLDGQPVWVQALIAGASAALAALGIVPPQVPTRTVRKRGEDGYGLVELLIALVVLIILVWLLLALVPHR